MRVIVAACGTQKADRPAPAKDLYTGRWAYVPIRWAMSVDPDALVILSAKHGFVWPEQVLEPYNVRIGDPGSVSVRTLRRQAAAMGIADATDVHVLPMQVLYRKMVGQVWPHAVRLFCGVAGSGWATFNYIEAHQGQDVAWKHTGRKAAER